MKLPSLPEARRFIAPAWFVGYLSGVGMIGVGLILLGSLAFEQDNEVAGSTLLVLFGCLWTAFSVVGHRRRRAKEAAA